MPKLPKWLKIYLFPILALIIPALAAMGWDYYHRHFRGVGTPFLIPAMGLLLLSLFFWIRKKWMYFCLLGLVALYLFFFFKAFLTPENRPPFVVHYYQGWKLDTATGLLGLNTPLGPHPPSQGAYVSCTFNLTTWLDFLRTQPILCTAFDKHQRLKMILNDGEGANGPLREFQVNYFSVDRKSLLGEPLDRWAIRLAYRPLKRKWFPHFQLQAIYQVFEREISPGKTKIVESFSREANGHLKSFTESPAVKFSQSDVYALYGPDGELMEIPRRRRRSFSFPAKIDVRGYEAYPIPSQFSSP